MSDLNTLPTIIKATYDGSAGFPRMVQEARDVSGRVRRQFENDFTQIGRTIETALSKGLNKAGSIDLNVTGFTEAAAKARAYRASLDELRAATVRLARDTGDTSAETRSYIAALSAQAVEARRAERAAEAELASHTRLQAALNRSATEVQGLSASYRQLELARNAANIADANAEVRNRRFTSFTQAQGIGPEVANNARDAARAFEDMFRAEDRAAAAAQELARDLGLVRAAIDPTYVAQQRLDVELDRAERLFQQGAINAEQYGRAVNAAANNFETLVTGARAGTTANHMMVNSSRAVRLATLQAGQQVQDLGISLYSGQKASVVFAQQLPQLAFALTGLEGSANKTHDRIGRLATYLSGPWGLFVGIAIGVTAELASELLGLGEDAEKATTKTYDFSKGLDVLTLSAKESANAMDQLREATRSAIQEQGDFLQGQKAIADKAVSDIEARLSANRRELERLKKEVGSFTGDPTEAYRRVSRIGELRQAISADQSGLNSARQAQINAEIAVSQRRIVDSMDAASAATTKYKEAVGELNRRIEESRNDPIGAQTSGRFISQAEYDRQFERLTREKDAAIEAARKSKSGGSSASEQDSIGDMVALLKQLFPGVRITSTTGGKHTEGSDHYKSRAIDFVPAGGMGQFTKAQVRQMLDDAGVNVRRNASGVEQFFGPGDKGHNNHFHVAWQGKASPEGAAKALERQRDAMDRLREFAADAASRVASMRQSFDDTPPLVARANDAMARLDDLSDDIGKKLRDGLDPKVAKLLQDEIARLKPVIEDSINKPLSDMAKAAGEQKAIMDLLIAGREVEAEVLRRVLVLEEQRGPLSDDQISNVRDMVVQERLQSRELQKQNELRQRQVQLIEDTQQNIRDTIYGLLNGGGFNSIGDFFKRQWQLALQSITDDIMESLFGDTFRNAKDKALGFDKVKEASERQVKAIRGVIDALNDFKGALRGAANDNAPGTATAAIPVEVSNVEDIVVVGKKTEKTLKSELNKLGKSVFGKETFGKLGEAFKTLSQGAAYGQAASGLLKSLGVKQSKTAAAVGGAIGNAAFGPIGGAIGGAIFGTIGGLFKKTPKGRITLTGVDSPLNYSGSGKLEAGVTAFASGVQGALGNIIDALNGVAGDFSVSVGMRGKKFTVDPTGAGRTKGAGVLKFKSEEDAARAALLDAIKDGAVKGITEGAQRLLQAGQDIDKQLAKAVKFQGVFDALKEIKDPIGYSITALNREFEDLNKIFREAGASAAEFAQLEELYGIKRARAIEEASENLFGSLKQLIDDLQIGDAGLSLRTRLTNARAVYDPLASTIRSGGTVDYDKFSDAARSVLDIARELYGSQQGYFDVFNDVLGLSKQALAGQQNVVSLGTGVPAPDFGPATPTADTVPVVAAINDQSQLLLEQLTRLNASNADIAAALQVLNNSPERWWQTGTHF